jgi:hypothetical protein
MTPHRPVEAKALTLPTPVSWRTDNQDDAVVLSCRVALMSGVQTVQLVLLEQAVL